VSKGIWQKATVPLYISLALGLPPFIKDDIVVLLHPPINAVVAISNGK
jgi:hypothetical protein